MPDAPGFGFSNPVTEPGWATARTARAYDELMRRLGYTEYGVHGSDNGAMVARELGLLNPDGFLGLHVLQLFSFPSGDPAEFERLEPQDYAGLEHMQWFQSVGGYNTMNASRPQTVAVGLSDSPVGLLAYSELFNSFGNGTSLVPLEKILTEVSVNWFANAASGEPVKDLERYLGAFAHALIVNEELTEYIHAHPEEMLEGTDIKSGGGPDVVFHTLFPKGGRYKAWVQFQRAGKLSTVSFTFRVLRPGENITGR